MKISNRGRSIQASPIRKLATIANETRKNGINVYHLNIGQPDIHTPEVFYEAVKKFNDKVLSYGPSDGLPELKTAMKVYFKNYDINLSECDIVITNGGSESISFAFNVISDPDDEILIPEPFYTNYNGYASLSNVKVIPITTKPEEGFHLPEREEIEKKISDKTRAILICSPNNPTGTIYSEEEIRMIGEIVKENDLYLIADEVYKEFTYGNKKHFSVLELDDIKDRVIVVDSISKRYSACGARIGAVISKNKEVIASILKFAQARLCPPTLEQVGAIASYKLPLSYFNEIRKEYEKRRDTIYEILTSNKEVVLQKPEGAFYIMAKLPIDDSDKFARWMLEEFSIDKETVMVAPGGGFYASRGMGRQEVRIAYVLERDKLKKAGEILLKGIEEYGRINNL